MVKKQAVFLFIFFLSFALLPNEVLAQSTDSASINTKPILTRDRMAIEKEKLQEKRAAIQENRQEIRASREAVMKEKREDFREKLQEKRTQAQEKFKAKREAFQQKITTIKDENKKQLIERLDTKISTVHTNRTNQMLENIEKLVSILANMQEKTTSAKESGKNTSSVDSAITKAETAINNAKTAVEAQAGKEYVITITATGSGQLKNSVGATTKQLQADLSASHKLIVAAKQAVQQVHMELSKVLGALGAPILPTSTGSAATITQ